MSFTTSAAFIVVLFGSFILAFIITMHIIKRRMQKIRAEISEEERIDEDRAYNVLVSTEKIAERLRGMGIGNEQIDAFLRTARFSFNSRRYERCVELCKKAKEMMEVLSRKPLSFDSVAPQQERKTEEVPPRPLAETEMEGVSLSNFSLDEYIKKKDAFMPAKFTIQMAEDAISKGQRAGRDTSAASEVLASAKRRMEEKKYQEALALAYRAKRIAEGKEEGGKAAEKKDTTAEKKEQPAQKEKKIEEGLFCPSCHAQLEPDDRFCWKCGSKIEIVVLCPKCGYEAKAEDNFCRKCGAAL